jgi:hypothetical protein
MATLIYLDIDSDAAKGNCNCNRNYPWNFMDFALAVLRLWTELEETLLGSSHWESNREIPILTFLVERVYIDSARTEEQQSENHLFFLCELVCCFSP